MELNKIQTPLDDLHIENYSREIQDQFWEFFNSVPFIKNLTSIDRKRACELPRDSSGKIIIDITNPHILEDVDYFRQTAIHYQKTGKFTDLKPNGNKNSDYYKWVTEEVRRCRDGYVRESDGEWVTGDYYFFLNYCPMLISVTDDSGKGKKKNKAKRIVDFPRFWEGHYWITHYLYKARQEGHHAGELSSRGRGKTYLGAAFLTKRFILGESKDVNREVQCVVTAYERKFISGANQILDIFKKNIDFLATNTEFPSKKLVNSMQGLQWVMGYKDLDTDANKGTLNSVIGITSKDDESKLRGSRGVLYLIEEAGTFPRLLNLYSNIRPSVEDGDNVFGQIFFYGTAGDESSDFAAMQEMMYNPRGYNILSLSNVYDKEGQGRKEFTFFFPGYINMANCYDENGNSDVTRALLNILIDRYTVKYNSSDVNAVTKRIAEIPITPQEAIVRTTGNYFPVTELNARLNQIDNNQRFYDDVLIGTLVSDGEGVKFVPTTDTPIRDFPTKDNKQLGAIEFYELPVKDSSGKPTYGRYIIGHDPVDDDSSDTMSLTSTFVFDLFTDQIVAEYTGRQPLANDNFEIVRKLCIFYNAKCLFESNKKGLYSYFEMMHCSYLLADTPEYLKERSLVASIGVGNKGKGVSATLPINNYANSLIRDWMLKPIVSQTKVTEEKDGVMIENAVETSTFNLYNIRNRALIKEAILFNANGNFDRIRALGMVMLYREEYLILYGGDSKSAISSRFLSQDNDLGDDPFFNSLYRQSD